MYIFFAKENLLFAFSYLLFHLLDFNFRWHVIRVPKSIATRIRLPIDSRGVPRSAMLIIFVKSSPDHIVITVWSFFINRSGSQSKLIIPRKFVKI